jgi:hypothetical protein
MAEAPRARSDGTTSGNGTATRDDAFWSSTSLPPCKLGEPYNGEPCFFRTDGRCYDEQIEACACACPTNKSVCVSGFPASTGIPPADVSCD